MAAIFFDIDGTLWDRQNVIPESTKKGIEELHKNGHQLFLCSGRSRIMIKGDHLHALGFDGILAGCGTYVEYKGEVKLAVELEPQVLRNAIYLLQSYKMPILIEGINELYMDDDLIKTEYGSYLKKLLEEWAYPLDGNDDVWRGSKISTLIREAAYHEVIEKLEADYDILDHGGLIMELVPKGFSKASGIQFVCELLGIDQADTYAFGDGINDCEMLRYVAHGIAMGNGSDAAKQAADYVTTDIHDDGIYNALKHFELI